MNSYKGGNLHQFYLRASGLRFFLDKFHHAQSRFEVDLVAAVIAGVFLKINTTFKTAGGGGNRRIEPDGFGRGGHILKTAEVFNGISGRYTEFSFGILDIRGKKPVGQGKESRVAAVENKRKTYLDIAFPPYQSVGQRFFIRTVTEGIELHPHKSAIVKYRILVNPVVFAVQGNHSAMLFGAGIIHDGGGIIGTAGRVIGLLLTGQHRVGGSCGLESVFPARGEKKASQGKE